MLVTHPVNLIEEHWMILMIIQKSHGRFTICKWQFLPIWTSMMLFALLRLLELPNTFEDEKKGNYHLSAHWGNIYTVWHHELSPTWSVPAFYHWRPQASFFTVTWNDPLNGGHQPQKGHGIFFGFKRSGHDLKNLVYLELGVPNPSKSRPIIAKPELRGHLPY